jgi:intraflagellar transport protein 172
VAEKSHHG